MFEELNNVPDEMKLWPQWIVWRYEDLEAKKPTKVPYCARSGRLASVTDPTTWGTFEEVFAVLQTGWYAGAGFVLTKGDPFAFADLDDTEGDAAAFAQQQVIFNESQGYAELSPSGKGLHIIMKADIPTGRRRGKIEIYSSARYMTMTGKVYRPGPVLAQQELATSLFEQLGKGKAATAYFAGLEEPTETDEEVFNRAFRAANGDKFGELWAGRWEGMYSSQSEADFALVDILAFYTQNRAQIVRMFRLSELGKRDKAKRDDYINYMLNKCFDRILPPVDIDGLRNQIEAAIAARKHVEEQSQNQPAAKIVAGDDVTISSERYPVPPGLVGEIARFIYAQAPRQIPEVAIAGALGFVAGITGRAFNVSATGLNQYLLLLAPTGVGKEAMARGIDKLVNAVIKTVPTANEFMGPGSIASSPALIKYMSKGPKSFVSIVGEFGLYLQQLGSHNAPPHLIELRKLILDLYNKSGQGNMLRPSIYSDRDKNTPEFPAPGFSLLGESTPEKFYEGLHEGLLSEGLLPRFTIIEYHGKKPELNRNHANVIPSPDMVERLASLFAICQGLNSQSMAQNVGFTPEAQASMDQYEIRCTAKENAADRDIVRQVWSRCHVKAMKLAAIVAVGCNPYAPTITEEVGEWARKIVNEDAVNLLKRFDAGEIGIDNEEQKQLAALMKAVKSYVVSPWPEVAKYSGDGASNLHSARIVPYSFLHRKLAAVAVFRKDRQGATQAIKRALKTLTERGDLAEMSRAVMSKEYGSASVAYAIERPSAFEI
ncbi:replicative primase/helicase [Rhodobacter phage RcSpartan]|uniref:Replicative primase/helicase n=1 Tax=Rhodobacter phage RcSpartan TaxID=1662331 RepID=A0A0K1LM18_9CAUD|nr:DNA primase [Rhodobacter phage RcSpartan]AKU43220.1 replicative primase/helicase [Rhodobacter phage RcSpartan]